MKKLSILFASLFIAAFVITSCTKVETSEGTNNLGKATISGKVYMDYDVTVSNNDDETAPTGTQLIATIAVDDLAQDGTGVNVEKKTYYTTVDANGEYTFTIDAGAKNVNVTIKAVDVIHSRTTYVANGVDGNGNTIWSPVVDDRWIWTSNGTNATVTNKDEKVRDIYYN